MSTPDHDTTDSERAAETSMAIGEPIHEAMGDPVVAELETFEPGPEPVAVTVEASDLQVAASKDLPGKSRIVTVWTAGETLAVVPWDPPYEAHQYDLDLLPSRAVRREGLDPTPGAVANRVDQQFLVAGAEAVEGTLTVYVEPGQPVVLDGARTTVGIAPFGDADQQPTPGGDA